MKNEITFKNITLIVSMLFVFTVNAAEPDAPLKSITATVALTAAVADLPVVTATTDNVPAVPSATVPPLEKIVNRNRNLNAFRDLEMCPETMQRYIAFHGILGALMYTALSDFGSCSNTTSLPLCQSTAFQITKFLLTALIMQIADELFCLAAKKGYV